MAQTTTRKKPSGSRGKSRPSGAARPSSRSSSSTRRRQSRNGASKPNSRSSSSRAPTAAVKQAASKGKEAVTGGAQSGGQAISSVASKVKGPALAGGAALAGLAGGAAWASRRNSGRRTLGMRMGNGAGKASKNLADASKNVGRFGENLGALAAEMQRTREALDEGSKGRSPVEVVLRALTARH
jgi:hypothetical protein